MKQKNVASTFQKISVVEDYPKDEIWQEDIADYVSQLQAFCHAWADERGWWKDPNTGEPIDRNVGDMMMLMVTELGEGYEGFRKNLPDPHCPGFSNLEVELADCMIRILDFAGGHNLRLGAALAAKMVYNCTRKDHSLSERAKTHGKKV